MEHIDTVFYKLRFMTYGLLMVAGFLTISLLLSVISSNSARLSDSNAPASSLSSGLQDSPNVVTNAFGAALTAINQSINTTNEAIGKSTASISTSGNHIGSFASHVGYVSTHRVASIVTITARNVSSGIGFMAQTIGSSLVFVIRIPFHFLGYISHAPFVSSAIHPQSMAQVPTIDSQTVPLTKKPTTPIATKAVAVAKPPTPPTPAPVSATMAWPLHGTITTYFGVPEWPYQPIHTGLDISDGRPAGVSPVKSYKQGRVIQTVHSYSGLGNHVVVDHGGGVTSVYGHLASIAVQAGQAVNTNTTLGMEGSTGASTGTHLHFEIRTNGQAVNPLQQIPGRP